MNVILKVWVDLLGRRGEKCDLQYETLEGPRTGWFPCRLLPRCMVVDQALIKFVQDVWKNPEKIASVNTTDICLIPKTEKLEFSNQFRPISLCNVTYKTVSRVIVNRLKHLMPNIISPFQTGFIPTRSIHENIVVAQEMDHNMRKMKGRTGSFAIKVDLAKAYDRLRWSFIHGVLKEVGLPTKMINMIMHCIVSVRTNVLWNGNIA